MDWSVKNFFVGYFLILVKYTWLVKYIIFENAHFLAFRINIRGIKNDFIYKICIKDWIKNERKSRKKNSLDNSRWINNRYIEFKQGIIYVIKEW